MTLEAKLTAEALKQLGLSEVPKPRYDDLPAVPETPDIGRLVNHTKAKMLVDPLLTAKFTRYIPDEMIVDPAIDTLSFRPDWSIDIQIDTTRAPSVNAKLTRVTGIRPVIDDGNFMLWLGLEIKNRAAYFGSYRIGPPQVYRTKEYMGVMVKFDRTPQNGRTIHDSEADIGLLMPQ